MKQKKKDKKKRSTLAKLAQKEGCTVDQVQAKFEAQEEEKRQEEVRKEQDAILAEQEEERLKKDDNIILAAFGGGFTWGSLYLKWAYNGSKNS